MATRLFFVQSNLYLAMWDTCLCDTVCLVTVSARARKGGGTLSLSDSIKPPVWSRRFVAKFVCRGPPAPLLATALTVKHLLCSTGPGYVGRLG